MHRSESGCVSSRLRWLSLTLSRVARRDVASHGGLELGAGYADSSGRLGEHLDVVSPLFDRADPGGRRCTRGSLMPFRRPSTVSVRMLRNGRSNNGSVTRSGGVGRPASCWAWWRTARISRVACCRCCHWSAVSIAVRTGTTSLAMGSWVSIVPIHFGYGGQRRTKGSNSCTKAWRPAMPAVPRIRRADVDEADVYRPAQGIPVIATVEYAASGITEDVEALAIAWTRECVEVVWSWKGEQQADWIEARCVKRR